MTTRGKIKVGRIAPAVQSPVKISPADIHLHVRFIDVPRAEIGRVTPVPPQSLFYFRGIALNPTVNRGVIN
ncbi:MAG: hypothetical protein HamCj_21170 [Candidatus Hamiltonella defensa (Ceratovacuna japonica)]